MRRVLLVLLLFTLGASACSKKTNESAGGGNSESPSVSESAAPAPVQLSGTVNNHGVKDLSASGPTVDADIDVYDFFFEPTFVKTAAGAKVTLALKNEGKAQHTFTIDSLHVDKPLAVDAKITVTFTLPASGVVNFYCRFHKGSGMQGAFFFI